MFRVSAAVVSAIAVLALCACGSDPDASMSESEFLDRFGSEVYDEPLSTDGEHRALAYAEVTCVALREGESQGILDATYVSTFVDIQQVKAPQVERDALVRAVQLSVEYRCPQFTDVVAG